LLLKKLQARRAVHWFRCWFWPLLRQLQLTNFPGSGNKKAVGKPTAFFVGAARVTAVELITANIGSEFARF